MNEYSRRGFILRFAAGAAGAALLPGFAREALAGTPWAGPGTLSAAPAAPTLAPTGWDLLPGILARIRPPVFPRRDFPITRFGAKPDGATDNTAAFRKAIAACARAGGGRVVVPEGEFLTGPIHLKSNVELHLVKGATILFSTDPNAYLPRVLTRWEGVELMGLSPLIYAYGQRNIAVTGEGLLDGQADERHWWPWKGNEKFGWSRGAPNQIAARKRLFDMAEKGVPVSQRAFGPDDLLRPQFFQPYRCTNVLIEGVTIRRSPMWELHPVLCRNVTVRLVTIDTYGPNNDGCDPESCRDVLIEECSFNTGDDCIAIKSGRNADGRRLKTPSENIVIRNCAMKDGHGGVSVGSEISGGVRNVFIDRCRMDSPNLERALRLKTNAMRGGVMEHIYMRDVTVGQVAIAVLDIDFNYEEGPKGPFAPIVREVELRGVSSRKSEYALFLKGFPADPITDVRLVGCDFLDVARPNVIENVRGLKAERTFINGRALQVEATS
jgi:polygalacturonase